MCQVRGWFCSGARVALGVRLRAFWVSFGGLATKQPTNQPNHLTGAKPVASKKHLQATSLDKRQEDTAHSQPAFSKRGTHRDWEQLEEKAKT